MLKLLVMQLRAYIRVKLTDTQFEAQIAVPVHWQTSSTVRTVFRLKLLTLSSKPRQQVLDSKKTKRNEAKRTAKTRRQSKYRFKI